MQRLSPGSLQLLCIFDALGGDRIPKLLFEVYLTPQPRWNEEGHIVRVGFGFGDCPITLHELLNTESLTICLEELLLGSWIYQDDHGKLFSPTFSLTNEAKNYSQWLSNKDPLLWNILGLQLSCHTFPRDPVLDENFNKKGIQLAHIIDYLCLQAESYDLSDSLRLELAEVLVAKARLGRLKCTEQSLEKAIALFDGVAPDYIQASIALRRSISLRLEGSFQKSEKVIFDYQEEAHRRETSNTRLRALNRLIMISHVENLIQLEDYETGRKEIHNLNDSEPNSDKAWSLMDLSVNFKKWSTVSKIYQSQGYLNESRDYLSNCYPYLRSEEFRADPNRFQIICRLSDLLCADGCLDNARSKIEHELYLMGVHGKLIKASRRLEVSMLDVNIEEGRLKEASTLALSLKGQFSRIVSPDISDQWLHVRSVVASARLLYCQGSYPEAVSEWRNLLLLTKKYPLSFEPEGFYFGLGHMSMSVALLQSDQSSSQSDDRVALELREKDAKKALDIGCDVLARENLNFWIPLLPKRYIPDLMDEIKYLRPAWADTLDFKSLQKKYTNFLDFATKKSGFASRI
ncbi:unnamed protein product [Penicillium pancosmium]